MGKGQKKQSVHKDRFPALSFKNKDYKSKKLGTLKGRKWKNKKQILQLEDYNSVPMSQTNYLSIKAPPSVYPTKKYCDFSGFEAKYMDPKTKMRYCNTTVFSIVRQLSLDQIHEYLNVRKASTMLK